MPNEITIVLPIPLPTWNRILSMRLKERMRLKSYIHLFVSLSIRYGENWPTVTVFRGKHALTESLKLDYLMMIRPSSSAKSDIPKRKRTGRRRRWSR